jgi:ferredoxin
MKIKLSKERCIASGACVLECPEIFQQDDIGMVVVTESNPRAELHDAVRRATAACPASVIDLEE